MVQFARDKVKTVTIPLAESENAATLGGFPQPHKAFANLAPLEAGNFWFRNRNRLIVWALAKFFPHAKTFMEVGCGTGFVLTGIHNSLPTLKLTGSELFEEGLEYAKVRLPHSEFIQLDARKMRFRESFDVIGSFDVLEHIDEDTLVLDQMRQAVTKGGGIIISVPQHPSLWCRADDYACHVRRYTRSELLSKAQAAGFEVLYCNSFVTFLLPVMILSRLLERISPKPYDPLAELKLSPTLNCVFEFILKLEQETIKRGVNYDVGGSLLMVARAK